jgi:hypothetical protein
MATELLATRRDAAFYLAWTASISILVTGVVLYALVSKVVGTAVIFLGVVGWLLGGGSLDLRAHRRLKNMGRAYDVPSTRMDFWRRTTFERAVSLAAVRRTPREALTVLLAPPTLAVVLGVLLQLRL